MSCAGSDRLVDDQEADLQYLLQHAEAVRVEDIGDRAARPHRVTLRKGDVEPCAIFKILDITTAEVAHGRPLEPVFTDGRARGVVAHRIDRRLGIGLVPVTMPRTIDGERGSPRSRIEDANKYRTRSTAIHGHRRSPRRTPETRAESPGFPDARPVAR